AMMRYTAADSLLMVGNRMKAQELALSAGAAVLITGGFDTEEHIKRLADEKQLPLISTSYDTFTVATMINRAIYDQLIKKEKRFVEDIAPSLQKIYYVDAKNRIAYWYRLNEQSKHSRFPVVDKKRQVIGMVTSKDVIGQEDHVFIEKVLTKNPLVVQGKTSLAYVAHMMVWEGIELVPIVDQSYQFQGIVSRQDVLKALQQIQRQPQVGETIDDIVSSDIMTVEADQTIFQTTVTPQMTNQLGTLSYGVFTALITEASSRLLLHVKKSDLVVENLTVYFIKPVQIDSRLIIKPHPLEIGRIYAKIDVEIFNDRKLVGKGLIMAQLIDR